MCSVCYAARPACQPFKCMYAVCAMQPGQPASLSSVCMQCVLCSPASLPASQVYVCRGTHPQHPQHTATHPPTHPPTLQTIVPPCPPPHPGLSLTEGSCFLQLCRNSTLTPSSSGDVAQYRAVAAPCHVGISHCSPGSRVCGSGQWHRVTAVAALSVVRDTPWVMPTRDP